MTENNRDSLLHSTSKPEMIPNPFQFRKEVNTFYPFVKVSRRSRTLLHIFFWSFGAAVMILLVSFIREPWEAIIRGISITCCVMFVFYGCRYLVGRFYEKKQYQLWLALTLLLTVTMAGIRLFIDVKIIRAAIFKAGPTTDFDSVKVLKLYAYFLVICVLFAILSSLYHITKNRLNLEHHYTRLKLQHVETQLNFLKAQVNPHFLFNTLNNIYAAAELKNANAPGMILQLSQLLRYITYTVQQKSIPLEEEWAQIENYVQLFRSRNPEYEHPIALYSEGDLSLIKVPPMLLLPLVENAIKYSDIYEHTNEACLKIHLLCTAEQLHFSVINTYTGTNEVPDANSGVGNKNLYQRLELEYPNRFLLKTEKESRIFTAELTIHFHD